MVVQVATRRFTVDEYHRMAEAGILKEDDRVELIDGEIVQMSPIGKLHAACVKRLIALLTEQIERRAIVGAQDPLQLSDDSEPQPDITVLRFRSDYYAERLPTPEDTLLIIEVADTSLAYDQDVKLPRYARGGVPELWIVNLQDSVVELYRDPAEDSYGETRLARRGEVLPLPGVADAQVSVDEILG